jgi:transposase
MNRSVQALKARQRAALILKVRSGQLTATAAARTLGISRQAYYQWESRALKAMLAALEEQSPGRPPKLRDPKRQALEQQVEQLQKKLRLHEEREKLQQIIKRWEEPGDKTRGSSTKKKR